MSEDDAFDDGDVSDDDFGGGDVSADLGHSSKATDAEKLMHSVIFGSMTELPQDEKNVIRIFLSSTFTDTQNERNQLMENVYPTLKAYCRDTYQKEFQVVDMRWGIQPEANDDHSTSGMCMKEIVNSQRDSAGPAFVCLLGDRYGSRFLKSTIMKADWDILEPLIESGLTKQRLEQFYKLDDNAIPPQMVLQNISDDMKTVWWESSENMYVAIKDAAVKAKESGKMKPETAQKYIQSVTEEEVALSGLLSSDSEHKPRCLAFLREIENMKRTHADAWRFVDKKQANDGAVIVEEDDAVDDCGKKYVNDSEKRALLKTLKMKVKESLLPSQVYEYSVGWSDTGDIGTKENDGKFTEFCKEFEKRVRELIDSTADKQNQDAKQVYDNAVTREVLAHSKQAVHKVSKAVARNDIRQKLKAYITGDSDRPMVVHGNSGCGKTTVMADAAAEAKDWLKSKSDKEDIAVVLRFLGTTPASSDLELLLQSLNSQLQMISTRKFDDDKPTPGSAESVEKLIFKFRRLVTAAAEKVKKLVIVIDSIDQLRENALAYNLSWIPKKLPGNVKFIISTLPKPDVILDSAKKLGHCPLEVKELTKDTAWSIINTWLKDENCKRQLSKGQRDAVSQAFEGSQLPPLYIKLVFDILVKWNSYSVIKPEDIPKDIRSCMVQLFDNLGKKHGTRQVKLALRYLTCCPGGISQNELEDTLSIDDEFLNSVYQFHLPPQRRIPPNIWVRMKSDIEDYIVEKESSGVAVMSWYHRQFVEYANERYVKESDNGTKAEDAVKSIEDCMKILIDYFAGKWSNHPKGFKYTQDQKDKFNPADYDNPKPLMRFVALQPTKYSRQNFNRRKISVLSQLWSDELMKKEVYPNSARYVMDIEFLTGKFLHDTWSNIQKELSAMVKHMDEKARPAQGTKLHRYRVEFDYVYAILKMYSGLLSLAPLSLPGQLFACLQDKYNLCEPVALPGFSDDVDPILPNLAWYLNQITADTGVAICPLLPVTKTLISPGGMLIVARQHNTLTKLLQFTYKDKSAVVAFSDEMVMHIIEDGAITERMTIPLPHQVIDATYLSFPGDAESYIFAKMDDGFCLISIEDEVVGSLVPIPAFQSFESWHGVGADVRFVNYKIFYNPCLGCKDSMMVLAINQLSDDGQFAIYSMKKGKWVWGPTVIQYPTKEEKVPQDIWCDSDSEKSESEDEYHLHWPHTSICDSDQSHVKVFISVFATSAVLYQLKMSEDGGVEVTEIEAPSNELTLYSGFKTNQNVLGKTQMIVDVLYAERCEYVWILDLASNSKRPWNYYKVLRGSVHESEPQMVGKLRNGTHILTVYSRPHVPPPEGSGMLTTDKILELEGQHVLELYSVKGHSNMRHSATLPCTEEPEYVYLVENSDVLIVVIGQRVSVYFLTALEWPALEVVLVYEFELGSLPKDLLANPRGFLVINSADDNCRFWDLTAVNDSDLLRANPRVRAKGRCNQVTTLLGPGNYSLTLQDHGHIWDTSANSYIMKVKSDANREPFVDKTEDMRPFVAKCFPGTGEWDYRLLLVDAAFVSVVSVKLPASPEKEAEMEMRTLCSGPFDHAGIVTHDTGIVVASKNKYDNCTILLCNVTDSDVISLCGTRCFIPRRKSEAMQGHYVKVLGCCFADNIIVVSAKHYDVYERAPDEFLITVYEPSVDEFKELDIRPTKQHSVFEDRWFDKAIYFKKYKAIVFTNSNPGLWLMSTEEKRKFKMYHLERNDTFRMLDNYAGDEGRYHTDNDSYFYIHSQSRGLLKMNLKTKSKWHEGEGITSLGPYPAFDICRLSQGYGYIAGVNTGSATLEVSKIVDDKLQPFGQFAVQGPIDKFAFSRDNKYITVAMTSGEVICLKLFDSTEPEQLPAEVRKLPCTQNPVCKSEGQMKKDSRWQSMVEAVNTISKTTAGRRTVDTLYNFVKNYVKPENKRGKWKNPLPVIGTKEFNNCKVLKYAFEEGKYVPVVEADSLLRREENGAEGGEFLPSKPKEDSGPPSDESEPKSSPAATVKPSGADLHKELGAPAPAQQSISQSKAVSADSAQIKPVPQPINAGEGGEGGVPTNVKLYQDLPADERNKRLDAAVNDVNQTHSSTCNLL